MEAVAVAVNDEKSDQLVQSKFQVLDRGKWSLIICNLADGDPRSTQRLVLVVVQQIIHFLLSVF